MTMLPEEFANLERFADWCLPNERERYAKRLASTIGEMQTLYEETTARAADAIAYCNQFPLDEMPDQALNLMRLMYSMIAVSFPVELWRQPRIPDTGAAMIDCLIEPGP